MQICWRHIKDMTIWLASIVVAVAFVAPLGQFFISLWDERGSYQHPNATLDAIIRSLSAVAANAMFHWVGGGIVGFAAGAWLGAVSSRLRGERSEEDAQKVHAQIKISELSPERAPFLLRLEFVDGGSAPKEIRSENVLSWYVAWSNELNVRGLSADGKEMDGFKIPKAWTIFIVFDKPSAYRQVLVQPAMKGFPSYEVKWMGSVYAVIQTSSDIPSGILDIYSKD
jgi:hypothetical protein